MSKSHGLKVSPVWYKAFKLNQLFVLLLTLLIFTYISQVLLSLRKIKQVSGFAFNVNMLSIVVNLELKFTSTSQLLLSIYMNKKKIEAKSAYFIYISVYL